KPANIMLDQQGAVFLTDFGLALISEIGTRGEIFGSPHYISPEQAISSAGAVPQSDLYAVGIILYEMFTNQLPFDADDPLDIAMLHMTEPVPSPREACPEISPELEAVILKALDKEPQARYSSGAELADALDQALQVTPAKASSPLSLASPRLTIFERVAIELAEHPLPPIPAVVTPPAPRPTGQRKVSQVSTASPTSNRHAIYLMGAGAGITLIMTLCLLAAVFLLTRGRTADRDPATTATLFETKISQASPAPIKGQTSQAPTEPTGEQTSQVPATPTVQYPEGRHFVVYYDDNSLYLLNNSEGNSQVAPLAFERLDASGVPLNRFEGWRWTRYYSTIMPGRCMRAEISDSASFLRPSQCNNRYNSSVSATRNDDYVFWTAQEGSYQFRVLWNEKEVARCEIAAGVCDVFLPDE
ncbi:MAG: serine/threonine protein kinase, partial [Chloroflexi bacterium]|nr:serine/threonine protein kinase [Chloroflexota bacterium]